METIREHRSWVLPKTSLNARRCPPYISIIISIPRLLNDVCRMQMLYVISMILLYTARHPRQDSGDFN